MNFVETQAVIADSNEVLLAIDTSLGSVVAVNRGTQVWQLENRDPLGHAESIGALMSQVMQLAGLRSTDVTGVVMGVGPGPFTGLRVGMAAARGFAIGQAIPLLPVISHEGSAYAAQSGRVRIVQDARRKELFVSDWQVGSFAQGSGKNVQLLEAPRVVPRDGYQPGDNDQTPETVSAVGLIEAALQKLDSGAAFAEAAPLYLRDPDVREPAQRVAP